MKTKQQGPNIIVLILDAVRADRLSCYGYERPTTPYLDSWAAHSVKFAQATAPAVWTVPSHASMFTGLYLSEHHLNRVAPMYRVNSTLVLLPDLLRNIGYETALFSQNPYLGPLTGLDRGFEHIVDHKMLTPRYRRALSDRVWNLIVRKSPLRDLVEARGWAQSSSRTVDAILGWLTKRATDRPFFVFANFMDVHGPRKPSFHHLRRYRPLRPGYWVRVYGAPDAYAYNAGLEVFSAEEMEIWHDLYDASLATLDVEIGRLLAELECLQYLDNTMLLITADHGDHLGDHEILGHGLSVYDSLIHVPLLVWHPEFSPREVNAPVELTSMFTTLAQVAGVPSGEYSSQTRRPSLLDNLDATARSSFSFSEYADDGGYHRHRMLELNPAFNRFRPLDGLVAVRSARYKYIWAKNGDDEFYDLTHDPQETNNLIAEAPHDLRNMRDALRDWQLSLNPYPLEIAEKWEENMDPKIVARLQALGYLDQ